MHHERKTRPKVISYEHYPHQWNRGTVRRAYPNATEHYQTRLHLPNCAGQGDLPPMTSPERMRVELFLQRQPEPDSRGCYADADDCTLAAIVQ